jgi:hypothetical protein
MLQKVVTWFLLLNLLNTLFFFEVPASLRPADQATVSVAGSESLIDSLVEFVLGYCLDQPDLLAEEDFDDTPDHLKRGKFMEFLLVPLPSHLAGLAGILSPSYGVFQEPLSSLSFDIVSPPPQA